jgi:YggT family protein
MALLFGLISLVLLIFQLLLVARAILDWSTVLAGPAAYGSVRSRIFNVVFKVTEPVLAPVRRVIPPLRFGSTAIDLSFIVVFLAVVLLRTFIF